MSLLDLLGLNRIFKAGVEVRPTRKILNFIGDGVTIVDNPGQDRTDITIAGGGSEGGDGDVSGPGEGVGAGTVAVWADGTGTSLTSGPMADSLTSGPVDSADGEIVRFNGTTGKELKRSLPKVADDGRITGLTNPIDPQDADTKAARDEAIAAASSSPSASSSSGWVTALDVNLTQAPAQTFVDGSQTWMGLPVVGKNIASGALVAAVQPGTGLVIQLNATATDLSPTADTGPSLRIPLTDLAPEFVLGSSRVRVSFQWRMINADADYEIALVGLRKLTFVANQEHWFRFSRGNHSAQGGAAYHRCAVMLGATETMIASGIPANNVDVLESDGLEVIFSTKQSTAPIADPNSSAFDAKTCVAIAKHAPAVAVSGAAFTVAQASELSVFIGMLSGNTNRNASVVIERIRVEYTASVTGIPATLEVVDNRITNLSNPVNAQDADTKAARDAAIVAASWQRIVDVNFVNESAYTFADGSNVWKGLTWTGANIALATNSFAIVPGSGLVLDLNAVASVFHISADNAPRIYLPLSQLPGFRLGQSSIRITWQVALAGADANYELAEAGLNNIPFVAGQKFQHFITRGYDQGPKAQSRSLHGGSDSRVDLPSQAHDVFELMMGPAFNILRSSKIGTAAPTASNDEEFTGLVVRSSWEPSTGHISPISSYYLPNAEASLTVVLAAESNNTTDTLVATFKRLRIEYLVSNSKVPPELTVVDNRITNLSNPVNAQDADTKAARDAAIVAALGSGATLYDYDFRNETPRTLGVTDHVAFTAGGYNWRPYQMDGKCGALAFTASGLRLLTTAAHHTWWAASNYGNTDLSVPPMVYILLEDLPGYNPAYELAAEFQADGTNVIDDNSIGIGYAFFDSTNKLIERVMPGHAHVTNKRTATGKWLNVSYRDPGCSREMAASGNLQDWALGIVVGPDSFAMSRRGQMNGGDWPAAAWDLVGKHAGGAANSLTLGDPNRKPAICLFIGHSKYNGLTPPPADVNFRKIRIRQRQVNPT